MMNQQHYEQQLQTALNTKRAQIDALEQAIKSAVKLGAPTPLPKPAKDILKDLSVAVAEAEQVINDHATDTIRVTDATLLAAAQLLKEAHTTMDSLILHTAVSGR